MRLPALLLLLTAVLCAAAQDWGLDWIAHPAAGPADQIWFRRTLVLRGRPQRARITVASGGRYTLYVNGYNVTADVLTPYAAQPSGTITVTDCEVGRFLRAGDNVVAVWYSPATGGRKQLALALYGESDADGLFAMRTDGTWMCRQAGRQTGADGSETADGNCHVEDWNMPAAQLAGWLPAEEQPACGPSPLAVIRPPSVAARISRTYRYSFLDDFGRDIVYRFGRTFDGWVRLTLRGMNRGDTVRVNGLTYVCSGRSDEQACRKFTTSLQGMAVVSGPEGFSRRNVTNIEGLAIEPYVHWDYLY